MLLVIKIELINLSKKNIGKYKKILSQKEIEIIEKELSEYLYS